MNIAVEYNKARQMVEFRALVDTEVSEGFKLFEKGVGLWGCLIGCGVLPICDDCGANNSQILVKVSQAK